MTGPLRVSRGGPLSLAAALVLAGCRGGGAPIPHQVLTSSEPLQRVFNADSGHVRAIFLASPT